MKGKIAVIDDNEQNLYLTTYLLQKNGYETITAQDGPTGLEAVCRERPDLILLDIQLPGMDGYEVARRLKASPESKDIPIVAVTSFAMVGDRERVLAAGCEGYMEKPIDPDTFIVEIERYLPTRETGQ